jgi:hypothetical protein
VCRASVTTTERRGCRTCGHCHTIVHGPGDGNWVDTQAKKLVRAVNVSDFKRRGKVHRK